MRRPLALLGVVAALAVSGCSNAALKNTQVLDVDSGAHLDPTGSFTVAAAWNLTYTFDCSSEISQRLAGADTVSLTVFDSDDQSYNFEHPMVSASGRSGGSTLHFSRGGTFFIDVTSSCSWRVVVVDLDGA